MLNVGYISTIMITNMHAHTHISTHKHTHTHAHKHSHSRKQTPCIHTFSLTQSHIHRSVSFSFLKTLIHTNKHSARTLVAHFSWNWLLVPRWSRSWHRQPTISARRSASPSTFSIWPVCNTRGASHVSDVTPRHRQAEHKAA